MVPPLCTRCWKRLYCQAKAYRLQEHVSRRRKGPVRSAQPVQGRNAHSDTVIDSAKPFPFLVVRYPLLYVLFSQLTALSSVDLNTDAEKLEEYIEVACDWAIVHGLVSGLPASTFDFSLFVN